MRSLPARLLFAALLVVSACSYVPLPIGRQGEPGATPSPYATAQAAYNVLLERFVDKPSSKTLLEGATVAVTAFAQDHGETAAPAVPEYTGDANADFARFSTFLDETKTRAKDVGQAELEREAVVGMAKSLNECHTYYVDPERAKTFDQPGGETYAGIGAVITQPAPSDPGSLPQIITVFPDSPAEKAGVKATDRIATVNGTSVAGLSAQEVANMIRGPAGTDVKLKLMTRLAGMRELTITRATLTSPVILAHMEQDIGYFAIPQIVVNAPSELRATLERLDQQGARGWILDLRSDPGGDLTAAQLIASTFQKSGVIVYEVGRDGNARALQVNDKAYYPKPKPLAVLVNQYSASGSEIIASTIQEHKLGRVFGEKTAGCVGIATPRELPDGGLLAVTTARMEGGISRAQLNGVGVIPDEIVTASPDATVDPVLDAAFRWVSGQRAASGN